MNPIMKRNEKKESAVSPVVGVMLMLVVTIIIAAVVSAFAGGLVTSAEKAPIASLETKIAVNVGWDGNPEPILAITHLSGDPIDTSKTKLVTSWTNRTTGEVNYRETVGLPYSKTAKEYESGSTVNLDLSKANVNNSAGTKYQEPYFVVPGVMPTANTTEYPVPSLWYGKFTLRAGDVMKSMSSLSTGEYYNPDGYNDYSVIKNAMQLTSKDIVTVQLIDIPSGNLIYDKAVYVL
ncbi:MAG TPA: type IV pilin N-terminal domain-containing protein [Methanocorpusculum sp.]|nr:type IV pilin N-terminal domain-containing protein [Methanocorpusculum sp.]